MKKIKKHLGEIFTILGVGISSYNIFGFSVTTQSSGLSLPSLGSTPIEGVAYYYENDTLIYISFGLSLITLGILIIINKK